MEDETEKRMLNNIRTFGNHYIKDSFIKPKPIEPMVYDKNYLCIGKKVESGQPYYLDLSEACRIIMVGATRSGKTFSIRSMQDRLALLEYDICHLNDCKDEFKSSIEPVQFKFRRLLFPNEKPRPTKVVTLRPTFFKSISEHLPKDNFWYSADVRAMTRNDFMTLMNVGQMTGPQKVIMEMIFEKMNLKFQQNPELKFSVDLIEECIDEIDDINTQQALSMKFKFRPLKTANFYDERYERDVVELMHKGYIPALNMENFESFGEGSFSFPDVMMSMVLRQVILARRAGKLRPTFIFFDEALRFVGKDKHTSIKYQVQESTQLDTRYAIFYCLEENTEIKLYNGQSKKIKDLDASVDTIVSFNFEKNTQEESTFEKVYTGEKEVFEIEMSNGKKIQASEDHVFFVEDENGNVLEKKINELSENDYLLTAKNYGRFSSSVTRVMSDECRTKISEKAKLRIGQKNPNYGNKWSEEKKDVQRKCVQLWRKNNSEWCEENDKKFSQYWKGKHFSKEHGQKIAEKNRLRICKASTKKLISEKAKKRWSEKTEDEMKIVSERFSKMHKGKPKPEEQRKKIGEKTRNRKVSNETRKKMSLLKKGRKLTDEHKEKLRIKSLNWWNSLTEEEKNKHVENTIKKSETLPNGLERYCISLFKKNKIPLQYVGDGRIIINGHCPDFINHENKIIVEVFCEYFKLFNYKNINSYIKMKKTVYSEYKCFFYNVKTVYSSDFIKNLQRDLHDYIRFKEIQT